VCALQPQARISEHSPPRLALCPEALRNSSRVRCKPCASLSSTSEACESVCCSGVRGCDHAECCEAHRLVGRHRRTALTRSAIMRTKALINHFHDLQPIYSAHFEPAAKGRLATAGGDNNVRVQPLLYPSRLPCLCTLFLSSTTVPYLHADLFVPNWDDC
jgi:hypothetical protein